MAAPVKTEDIPFEDFIPQWVVKDEEDEDGEVDHRLTLEAKAARIFGALGGVTESGSG